MLEDTRPTPDASLPDDETTRRRTREEARAALAAGDTDRALPLLRREAAHDDVEGLRPLAEHLTWRHKTPQAITLWTRLAELGDPWAPVQVAALHERQGRVDDAMAWLKRAADAHTEASPRAAAGLGVLLEEHGTGEHAAVEAERYRLLADELAERRRARPVPWRAG